MDRSQATDLPQDLGVRGPLLHLAHANGFPPGTCRLLAMALADAYHVVAWPNCQACFNDYRANAFFARESYTALWDYVNSGTVVEADGTARLRYPREWEAHIFATTPVHIWRDVRRLRTPVLFLRGECSEIFRPEAQARVATVAGAGHLLPMEKPAETAAAISAFLIET